MTDTPPTPAPEPAPHRRRIRYSGKNPRRFADKYKERDPDRHPDTIAKVLASGKTPAGAHRPICVQEILEILAPRPGETAVDATLGHGGHTLALLPRLLPGGHLIALDTDPIELPRAVARVRTAGYGDDAFTAVHTNFAALPAILLRHGHPDGADLILADLGCSSMQLDDPARGFSHKHDGPLDCRMNPAKGRPAADILPTLTIEQLANILRDNADEPHAELLARHILTPPTPRTTAHLAAVVEKTLRQTSPGASGAQKSVRQTLPGASGAQKSDRQAPPGASGAQKSERQAPPGDDGAQKTLRQTLARVFQALRMLVNQEADVLDALLRVLPDALRDGGRVAILTFHSGEDRRVKKFFESGLAAGHYSSISPAPLRPTLEETQSNPRATSAKLRWAIRAARG